MGNHFGMCLAYLDSQLTDDKDRMNERYFIISSDMRFFSNQRRKSL